MWPVCLLSLEKVSIRDRVAINEIAASGFAGASPTLKILMPGEFIRDAAVDVSERARPKRFELPTF
jgi:hypothetical protein